MLLLRLCDVNTFESVVYYFLMLMFVSARTKPAIVTVRVRVTGKEAPVEYPMIDAPIGCAMVRSTSNTMRIFALLLPERSRRSLLTASNTKRRAERFMTCVYL